MNSLPIKMTAVFLFFILSMVICPATRAQDTTSSTTSGDLVSSLTNISQTAITRDNYISLYLTQVFIAQQEPNSDNDKDKDKPSQFAVVIDVNLLPDAGEKGETYSYVLEQPLDVKLGTNPNASLAAGFRTIFSNISLKTFREIQVELHLIRLDEAARMRFSSVAGLFGSVVKKSMFSPLIGVLGLDADINNPSKVIVFDGRFLVPTNYWTHQNAKKNGFAVVSNDEPIAIAFEVKSAKNNTNVINYLKNVANKISQVVVGKNATKNYDNVQGFVVLSFTKNQFSPVPKSLSASLDEIKAQVEQVELSDELNQVITNSKFLFRSLSSDMPSSGRESVVTFMELAKLYSDYRKIYQDDAADNNLKKKLLSNFQSWLIQSGVRLQSSPETGPRVKDIYKPDAKGDLYPIVVYPYALSDSLIVSTVLWQIQLHKYVAEAAGNGDVLKVPRYAFRP